MAGTDAIEYEVVVIGAGPGGATTAKAVALAGETVALINDTNLMGYGLEGAYKSKALWEMARERHIAHCRWGMDRPTTGEDLARMVDANTAGANALRDVHRRAFGRLGVDLIEGRGYFVDPHTVVVGTQRYHARNIVIATGTKPRVLPTMPVDGTHILTSDHVVWMKELPASMLVLGAGVIGCEFASIFAALGVDVTLCDTRDRILSHEDPDISALLARSFGHLGVEILPSVRCAGMSVVGGKVHTGLGGAEPIVTDCAILAIGRSANTPGLNLDVASVETDQRGYVPVSDAMQTNVEHIYAVGDVGLRDTDLDLSLVHVAEAEGRRAASSICGNNRFVDMNHVPFIIFTMPMVAGAGDNETTARTRFGDVRVGKYANVRNHRAHAKGCRSGFVKLVVGPHGDDRVLGVRAVGDGVDTVVGEVSLMIQNGLPYTHLLDAIHAHPSMSESLQGAAMIIHSADLGYEDGEEFGSDFWIG